MKIIAAATAFVLIAVASPSLAQSSSSTTGSGSITAIRPLTITKTADLKFGTVVRPGAGSGTVVVSAAGASSVTGGVVGLLGLFDEGSHGGRPDVRACRYPWISWTTPS